MVTKFSENFMKEKYKKQKTKSLKLEKKKQKRRGKFYVKRKG